MSLLERKLIARIQRRIGPNQCGFVGILQPIADAVKLILKRSALSNHTIATKIGVCLMFTVALSQQAIILVNAENGLLLLILCHIAYSFAEVLIGRSSNSKYGVIGGHRAFIQGLCSSILFGLSLTAIILISQRTDLIGLCLLFQQSIWGIPAAIVFFQAMLMCAARTPFDFIEAESELVGGAYVECGGIIFALIYLSDYLNLMFISALTALMFSSRIPQYASEFIVLFAKAVGIAAFIVLIRAILPRYTQTQMIVISLKYLTPIILSLLFVLSMIN